MCFASVSPRSPFIAEVPPPIYRMASIRDLGLSLLPPTPPQSDRGYRTPLLAIFKSLRLDARPLSGLERGWGPPVRWDRGNAAGCTFWERVGRRELLTTEPKATVAFYLSRLHL